MELILDCSKWHCGYETNKLGEGDMSMLNKEGLTIKVINQP